MTSVESAAPSHCPPAEQLACFLDGALAPSSVAELELHLGSCDRCCSIVAELAGPEPEPDDEDDAAASVAAEDRFALGGLGRYVLLERVGAGGMGVVWAAYDSELERRIAVKLLRSEAGNAGANARRRLVREARAMARVSHPNVVAVHDVVEEDDRVFMTMELVVGRTLGAWLRDAQRSWRAIVEVFVAAGRGLAAAHACGVVHRDFKPDNVLISTTEGTAPRVRVGDFGLAHTGLEVSTVSSERSPSVPIRDTLSSSAATFVGTPAYMAPEQFVGGSIDARTDQFAFCVAIWEALFGQRPFQGTNVAALAEAIAAAQIEAPADRHGVPARVEAVLRRGLARDPAARWPDMDSLLRALHATLARRRPLRWIAAAAIAVAGVVALAWPARSPCSTTPPWLASAWDEPMRARIVDAAAGRGEAATSLAAPLVAAIDEHVAALGEAFARSCRATFDQHVDSAEDHDARLGCLRRSAAAIAVVAEFAGDTDEHGLARASRAARTIDDADACEELARVRSDLPWLVGSGDRARASELGISIGEAVQLRRLGELARAREALAEPLAALDDPGLGSIAAAATFELALIEQREGAAGTRFHEALHRATAAGSDAIVFDVLNQLVYEAGMREHDRAAAEAYAELALAFVEPSRRGADARGVVLLSLGQARERSGDVVGARAALLESEAAFAATGTLELPLRFPLWIALGLLDELDGDLAAAERRYEDARVRLEQAYGAYHPDVAVVLEYLATVQRKRGALDEALASAERSRTIRVAVLGAQHRETAVALDVIGKIHLERGSWDEAEAAIGAAIEIWRAQATDQRGLALAEGALAEVRVRRGDAAGGLTRYRDALALAERTLGAEHPELAIFLLGVGIGELQLGRPQAALVPLERAATLLGDDRGEVALRGNVRLHLAQAIARSGGDRSRARALLDQAGREAAAAGPSALVDRLNRELAAGVAELDG